MRLVQRAELLDIVTGDLGQPRSRVPSIHSLHKSPNRRRKRRLHFRLSQIVLQKRILP